MEAAPETFEQLPPLLVQAHQREATLQLEEERRQMVEVTLDGKLLENPPSLASVGVPARVHANDGQGFVAVARDVGAASPGAGWRTGWRDDLSLGQGFHRETGKVATSAITYRPLAAEPEWTAKLQGNITVATNSKEYTEMATSGGSLSMEGWGASGEATLRDVDNIKVKLNTVTGVVSMRYLSEKIDMINPANVDQEVALTASAKAVLENLGPIKFHEVFGSHFISGLIKGGSFVGSFAMEFDSVESARQHQTSLKADFERYGLRAGGSADFERKLDSIKECVKYQGQYTCVGWRSTHPPKLICSLADLATAHDQFDPSRGCNMEAVLRRYEDIEDYRTALAKYEHDHPNPDRVSFGKEENYGKISSALNVEYLRIHHIRRLLEDEEDDALAGIQRRAVDAHRRIHRAVGMNASMSTVRTTFHSLEVFMIKYEGKLDAVPEPEDAEAWESGRDLHSELWCADALERELEAALHGGKPLPPRVPRNFGNGWTTDTSDGHLRFFFNGEQHFVLHNPENSSKVWSKESGYIGGMLRDGDAVTIKSTRYGHRLQHSDGVYHPATFANDNRLSWEEMVLEKL